MTTHSKRWSAGSIGLGIFVTVGMLGMMVCGYGYAALSQDLHVDGDATVKMVADVEVKDVTVTKTENGAIEGNNNTFTPTSASMYPQLPNANGKIIYTITTCNNSTTKRYELTGLETPAISLNTSLIYFENLIVGDYMRVGEVLEPGECLDSEVEFTNAAGDSKIAALQLDFTWKEYDGTPFASEYMQDLTPTECANVSTREQKQMIDKRDGKKYWIMKLGDGTCWMAQNLALDISGVNQTLYPETSDVSTVRVMPNATNELPLDGTVHYDYSVAANNTQHSWNIGNIMPATVSVVRTDTLGCINAGYKLPTSNSYGSAKSTDNFGTECGDWGFIDVTGWNPGYNVHSGYYTLPNGTQYVGDVTVNQERKSYDEHYLLGNYYQWNTATAGTGESTMNEMTYAPESICPKGWQLLRDSMDPGSEMHFLSQYGFSTNSSGRLIGGNGQLQNWFKQPLYFTRAGWADPYDGYFMWVGYYNSIWSAMAARYNNTLGITAYAPYGDFQYTYPYGDTFYRFFGMSVRCVLK